MITKYPIAIEKGDKNTAFGVVVPDLPGCFSAADDGIHEAVKNAKEAIELWIEAALDNGQAIPKPSTINTHKNNPTYNGWVWREAQIDLNHLVRTNKNRNNDYNAT